MQVQLRLSNLNKLELHVDKRCIQTKEKWYCMSETVIIVESPNKVKTIEKYLPKGYTVLATSGHIRDLIRKSGAVDPDNDFAMKYEIVERNQKHVDNIARAVKKASTLVLATDPDREGEAIAWSVYELMREKNILNKVEIQRIAFYEITKAAITEALKSPRQISMDLVNAQIARRALDYLVGFNLSPLLWKKVRRGLSAGRVQSPALRLIAEREAEIEKFVSQEYWSIKSACGATEKDAFQANLVRYDANKVEQFTVTDAETAEKFKQKLLALADGKLIVTKVEKRQRKRNPAAPFTTSTLQQEAARKLGFSTKRTMMVAQKLYEGIDIGEGAVGLITYMRTDSVNIANEAIADIREFISERYGKDNCPKSPRLFKTKAKNAQEAHEAIRPTAIRRLPDEIKNKLDSDQYKLYNLIWKRTIACQMIHATIDTVAATLDCGNPEHQFRANGSVIAKPGFITVYQEDHDDKKIADDDGKLLPPLSEGQEVVLNDILTNQHFTEPPPRYSEASLVKALEEYGIGRPSTYVPIISTLIKREYVILDKKRFMPTEVGRVVNKFLTDYFTKYVDYGFTSHLEDDLDAISRGEQQWKPILTEFWNKFNQQIHEIDETIQRKDVTEELLDEKCPKCEKPLCSKLGRNGKFIGCTGYPECNYTRNINEDGSESETGEPEIVEGRECPKCQSPMIYRVGRYGKFIGCSGYPKCKHIEPLEKPEDTQVTCPECKKGTMTKRKSRYGTYFYSCSEYPSCKYAINSPPVAQACSTCDWPITMIKTTKRRGTERVCPQKSCDFSEPATPLEDEAT